MFTYITITCFYTPTAPCPITYKKMQTQHFRHKNLRSTVCSKNPKEVNFDIIHCTTPCVDMIQYLLHKNQNMQEKSEMKFDVDWEANGKVSTDKQANKCKQGAICKLEWK